MKTTDKYTQNAFKTFWISVSMKYNIIRASSDLYQLLSQCHVSYSIWGGILKQWKQWWKDLEHKSTLPTGISKLLLSYHLPALIESSTRFTRQVKCMHVTVVNLIECMWGFRFFMLYYFSLLFSHWENVRWMLLELRERWRKFSESLDKSAVMSSNGHKFASKTGCPNIILRARIWQQGNFIEGKKQTCIHISLMTRSWILPLCWQYLPDWRW